MNKKLLISVLLTVLYAVITLFAVLHHEIWADEAQVWQLCKYLSLPELFHHLHNEGHPSLFYLMVMPFAKISFDIIYMQLICWGFMCLAVFLLFYKSPFPFIVKFSIVSSAGFLYFLPVIARNYSILPFFIFFAAILYLKRKENPILYSIILFLIANTHVIMLGFVLILLIMYVIETIQDRNNFKQKIIAISIITSGILALFLQLHDATSSNICFEFNENNLLINLIKVPLFFFINAYNQLITINRSLIFPIIDIPVILSLMIIFSLLFINLYINNKKLFIICFCGVFFQFFVYIFLYPAYQYVTRIFTAFIIIIFCFWIMYNKNEFNDKYKIASKKATSALISIFFIFTCYNGINYYILDYKYNYSGAKETSEFIKNNIPKSATILIANEPWNIANVYYLKDDYKLYSILREKDIKYIVWDELLNKRPDYSMINSFCEIISPYSNNIYIIFSYVDENKLGLYKQRIDVDYGQKFKLVFSSKKSIIKDEGFFIYKYIKK